MANDTLPMGELFQVCRKILDDELTPIHYVTLTEKALLQFGLKKQDVNWPRQIEDVREKLLEAGRYETFYTGLPYCLAGVIWWFPLHQERMFNPTPGIWIPGNASSGHIGAFEALMRDPYMKIKTRAASRTIKFARAKGLVIEQHVSDWFRSKWPEFWLPPDNQGQWKKPCPHDFKLNVQNRIYYIDVTGPRTNGSWGNPGQGKRRVDFHLLCNIVDDRILWRDTKTGVDYNSDVLPDGGIWPQRLIVWLNCVKEGIDHNSIKRLLNQSYLQII